MGSRNLVYLQFGVLIRWIPVQSNTNLYFCKVYWVLWFCSDLFSNCAWNSTLPFFHRRVIVILRCWTAFDFFSRDENNPQKCLFLVGVSKFFHNGYCLRKDAIAASIQKIEKILKWFEGQKQLNFYASSLLFVYEGSSQAPSVRLSDVTLAEKRGVPRGLLSGGDILEYNNNIHVISSTENGKIEASVSKGLSKFYALHKKAYSKRHHSQISLKVESLEQDNMWKSSTCIAQEHLNGNVIPQLEKVFCHMPAEIKESANVEVRMIDFAHVFPSNTKDEGYVYGLKNLITVLKNILDN